jgi:hypothetical protein
MVLGKLEKCFATTVSGVGDEAIYVKGGHLVWLSVKKGDKILNVKVCERRGEAEND